MTALNSDKADSADRKREIQKAYIDRNLKWVDISTEKWRKYVWADGSEVIIDGPMKLNVSKNGHRVEDSIRHGHYVPYGWKHLEWEAKEGALVFVY